jgi:hypothetical protein
MQVNKYLQHIIRKNSGKSADRPEPSLQSCVEDIQARKQQALRTYLALVARRLELPPHSGPSP